MQLPIRSCLFFPFGQASPAPLCRHYPCFPLRGEWRKAPREVSLNSALFFKPCPCSFFLRKNSQNCQPLRVFPSCLHKIFSHYAASPWGEALPQSGGDEGQFQLRYAIRSSTPLAFFFSLFPAPPPAAQPASRFVRLLSSPERPERHRPGFLQRGRLRGRRTERSRSAPCKRRGVFPQRVKIFADNF